MEDCYRAFIDQSLTREPLGSGPLNGLVFAVKDVFAVKGHRNAAGNPDWLRTHEAAAVTASAVEKLLRGGARLRGAAHTDELMYSLNGENFHYGTPVNPNAAGRIPGGSSSGSAVAVAAGEADFAIGTDTGGSVRIPSSYCGIYGFRPSHGAVAADGLIPLAPSFDTVGWMARDAEELLAVGKVLTGGGDSAVRRFNRVLVAEDIWSLAEDACRAELEGKVADIARYVGPARRFILHEGGYSEWMNTFRILQGLEIWRSHGAWIEAHHPVFGPGIAERFAWTESLAASWHEDMFTARELIRETMDELLRDGAILVMPTAPGPAPLLNMPAEQLETTRVRTLQICCIAGLAGLPQVTLPVGRVDGLPVGLSIVAGRGCDLALLELVFELSERGAL
ncbi:amidase [Paenibacillus oenotherae]|uniref:Amidase n=1 Tax=Paenibacillus oenotherae TaxID=1435645 RepID=A0ABS7DBF8_9BACL|nr:amidase [Paenibacillus oenotherae]MBW7477274.1 amidase [Paenibacillus oenotherae]